MQKLSCIVRRQNNEKNMPEKHGIALATFADLWHNNIALYLNLQRYRSGHNGADSKSESLFGSLQPEIPCM